MTRWSSLVRAGVWIVVVPSLAATLGARAASAHPSAFIEAATAPESVEQAGQRGKAQRRRDETKPLWSDFSYRYDPRDLYKEILNRNQWRRIWRPFGIGEFHIFPAQQSGPNLGPPPKIWGHGFGTSLWRDPITGHPLM